MKTLRLTVQFYIIAGVGLVIGVAATIAYNFTQGLSLFICAFCIGAIANYQINRKRDEATLLDGLGACPICGVNPCNKRTHDGGICNDCLRLIPKDQARDLRNLTTEEIEEFAEVERISERIINNFCDAASYSTKGYTIRFDDFQRVILIKKGDDALILSYSDILRVEVKQNNKIYTMAHGGVLRSVIGGAAFGLVGAMVGMATPRQTQDTRVMNMSIDVYTNDINIGVISIPIITHTTPVKSIFYKKACQRAYDIVNAFEIVAQIKQLE